MTPFAFEGLLARHKAELERQELLNGILAAAIVNSSWCHPEEPVSPEEFMPSQQARLEAEAAERAKPISAEEATRRIMHSFKVKIAPQAAKPLESPQK